MCKRLTCHTLTVSLTLAWKVPEYPTVAVEVAANVPVARLNLLAPPVIDPLYECTSWPCDSFPVPVNLTTRPSPWLSEIAADPPVSVDLRVLKFTTV